MMRLITIKKKEEKKVRSFFFLCAWMNWMECPHLWQMLGCRLRLYFSFLCFGNLSRRIHHDEGAPNTLFVRICGLVVQYRTRLGTVYIPAKHSTKLYYKPWPWFSYLGYRLINARASFYSFLRYLLIISRTKVRDYHIINHVTVLPQIWQRFSTTLFIWKIWDLLCRN